MKVYIVTDGSYSDYRIKRVFTNEKEAKKYQSLCDYDNIEIYETFNNFLKAIEENKDKTKYIYSAKIDKYLKIYNEKIVLSEDFWFINRGFVLSKRFFDEGYVYLQIIIDYNNRTKQEAEKICKDYLQPLMNEFLELGFTTDKKILEQMAKKLNAKL